MYNILFMYIFINQVDFSGGSNHKQKKTHTQPAGLSSNMTSNVSVSFTISPWKWFDKHPSSRDPRVRGWTQTRLYTTTSQQLMYIYIYEYKYTQHRDSMFGFQLNVGLMLNLLVLGSRGWISFRIYELGPLVDFLRSLGRLASPKDWSIGTPSGGSIGGCFGWWLSRF